ncbi:hypothetical protein NDU88_004990 [Pleurodeles waltl]|uniref:Uncharacterized protein n=1 Tax=Pleurodeles waltl TaxID=8319 RepID=A0AAV7SKH4_PLEWA|nr:hypothetical protein NDU88_004990 [Pleurodeles waltl]
MTTTISYQLKMLTKFTFPKDTSTMLCSSNNGVHGLSLPLQLVTIDHTKDSWECRGGHLRPIEKETGPISAPADITEHTGMTVLARKTDRGIISIHETGSIADDEDPWQGETNQFRRGQVDDPEAEGEGALPTRDPPVRDWELKTALTDDIPTPPPAMSVSRQFTKQPVGI